MTSHPNRSTSVFTTDEAARKVANVSEFGTYLDDDRDTWYFLLAAPGCWRDKTSVIAVSRDLNALQKRLNKRVAIYRGFALPGATILASSMQSMDRVA